MSLRHLFRIRYCVDLTLKRNAYRKQQHELFVQQLVLWFCAVSVVKT
jgi:hypothetical protein